MTDRPSAPSRSLFRRIVGFVAFGIVAAGAAFAFRQFYLRRPAVPVTSVAFPGSSPPTQHLVLLLPGRGGSAQDFVSAGFVGSARQAGCKADMKAVNLYESYYYNRTMLDRLEKDVLAGEKRPAWFVGVSLGGFGSVMYASMHPSQVAGIILIAPYLGEDPLLREIEKAGGLARWNPSQSSAGKDYEIALWKWLKNGHDSIPLYLAYGTEDRMADAHRILAAVLPAENVMTVKGGHDWHSWKALWTQILSKNLLPTS